VSVAWAPSQRCVAMDTTVNNLLSLKAYKFTQNARRGVSGPNYFVAGRSAKYCDERVCVSVCLSVGSPLVCLKNDLQSSRNFLHMLSVAAARSSSDDNANRYALPVLWMTSCFHITVNTWCKARLTVEGRLPLTDIRRP